MKHGLITVKVNFFDTDAMAVVHHANYFRWFEMGRVELLREAGITLNALTDSGYTFPIMAANCEYKAAAKFDDILLVETLPVDLTAVKMVFDYKVYRANDKLLLATGHTKNAFVCLATGKISKLPREYSDKLAMIMK